MTVAATATEAAKQSIFAAGEEFSLVAGRGILAREFYQLGVRVVQISSISPDGLI